MKFDRQGKKKRCAAVGVMSSGSKEIIWSSRDPAKYMRISEYCGWIKDTTNGEVQCIDPIKDEESTGSTELYTGTTIEGQTGQTTDEPDEPATKRAKIEGGT